MKAIKEGKIKLKIKNKEDRPRASTTNTLNLMNKKSIQLARFSKKTSLTEAEIKKIALLNEKIMNKR
jgi:hypothetical protein